MKLAYHKYPGNFDGATFAHSGMIPGHLLVTLPMQRKLRTPTTIDVLMQLFADDMKDLSLVLCD